MGFARSICNTKAKLAINRTITLILSEDYNMIDKSRKYWYGNCADDIDEFLKEYTEEADIDIKPVVCNSCGSEALIMRIDSNEEAIQKTQKNIALVGQREPGVTLADGRIVDGNRRYTCLRKIQREQENPVYFETVIMDMDIREDKKQIKLLELAIQHGEEKKVDYDLIDYAVGTYRDIVQTNHNLLFSLLHVELQVLRV